MRIGTWENSLRQRVLKDGTTVWDYRVHREGQPRQCCKVCDFKRWVEGRALKTCPDCGGTLETLHEPRTMQGTARTKREALAERSAAHVAVQQGTYANPGRLTLAQYLIDIWLPALEGQNLRLTTLTSYKMHVTRHIVPRLGGVMLKNLTGAMLTEHYGHLAQHGAVDGSRLSAATVRRVRAVMHRALADAVADGKLARNPADAVRRHRDAPSSGEEAGAAQTETLRYWSPEDLRLFLHAARDGGDRLYSLWHMMSMTGLRRGEALALRWDDIDMAGGEFRVCRNRVPVQGRVVENAPKTTTGVRVVPLEEGTLDVLAQWRRRQYEERDRAESAWQETGYIFTYEDGRPLDPRWVSRLFTRAVTKANAEPYSAKLPLLSIHGLRHTYATIALLRGAQPLVVSRILGHSGIRITLDTYAGVLKESRDDAAKLVAAAVAGSVTEPAAPSSSVTET